MSTYELERLKVARDLIAFDHKLSRLFSGKPMIPNSDILDGVDMDEFHQVYLEGNKFASGTIVDYEDSLLVSKQVHYQSIAMIVQWIKSCQSPYWKKVE